MPVYIGDYLADTMHLTTEQHGAYLLLLFHLWRRGFLADRDETLSRICGLGADAWSNARPTLEEFFEVRDGLWRHRRVERERSRIAEKQQSNSAKARNAAAARWGRQEAQEQAGEQADEPAPAPEESPELPFWAGDPIGEWMPGAVREEAPGDADSQPEADRKDQSKADARIAERAVRRASDEGYAAPRGARGSRSSRSSDPRHMPFKAILAEYWSYKNQAAPEMPWQARDAKALSELLAASPGLNAEQFRQLLRNRARSAVAHGDRVYLWIGNLTRFQETIGAYNRPAAAGGAHASRAEINRDSIVNAVNGALALAREHSDRAGQAGDEQTDAADRGMRAFDGPGSGGYSLAPAGGGDRRLAQGHAADGTAGTDGPLPYRTAVTGTGGAAGDGGPMNGARQDDPPSAAACAELWDGGMEQ